MVVLLLLDDDVGRGGEEGAGHQSLLRAAHAWLCTHSIGNISLKLPPLETSAPGFPRNDCYISIYRYIYIYTC